VGYAERSNLSIRMGSRRFTRLTNGFSKKLENHAAAVSLYVAHYNLCRWHETIRAARQQRPLPSPIILGRLASYWTPLSRLIMVPQKTRRISLGDSR